MPYIIESRPSQEFDYEAGKNKLIDFNCFTDSAPEIPFVTPGYDDVYESYRDGTDAGFTARQGRLLRLSARIDIESRLTVGCAGALLTYLGRRKATGYLPGSEAANAAFQISGIEMISLRSIMYGKSVSGPMLQLRVDGHVGTSIRTHWYLYKYCSPNPILTPIVKDRLG